MILKQIMGIQTIKLEWGPASSEAKLPRHRFGVAAAQVAGSPGVCLCGTS